MPRSDFSSSCGSEKLYGNALIDPPNGLARCGEFVSVINSCRSASRRWAMYLPEKPKARVTAIRTLAFHQADETSSQVITKLRHLPRRLRTRPANLGKRVRARRGRAAFAIPW